MLVLMLLCIGHSVSAINSNKILIISSYGTDYDWSNKIIDKLNYDIKSSFPGIELNVEYLSSEIFNNTDSWVLRMETILSNYKTSHPLAIVLISDEAWMAYRAVNTNSLKNVPIVLCAVKPHSITIDDFINSENDLKLSDFSPTDVVMKDYNATAVLRRMNVEGYLKMMADVVPDLDNFVFITDKRFYGQYTQLMLQEKVGVLYPEYPVKYISALTNNTNQLIESLSDIKPNTGVLLTSWLTGGHGYEYSRDFIYKHIESLLTTPIFITNDIGLLNGYFLGGCFNESQFWGERCSHKLRQIVKGVRVALIPVETYYDTQHYINWQVAHRYHLSKDRFPTDTIFLNQPESVFTKYRNATIFFSILLLIILITCIYIIINNLRLKKARKTALISVELANKANGRLREVKNNLTIALAKAEESERMKSSFISNMSHEIRTPLNAIVGFSDIITTADSPQEKAEYAAIIKRNSDSLLQLITDILDIAKIDSGTFVLSCMDVDASSICMDVIVAHENKCAPGVKLKFMSPENPIIISTDCGYITQLITNLMNNAIKFTNEGTIELGYNSYNDQIIEFYVKDTGIGIEAEKIPTVFDRFVKINSYVEGTGLGLALCKTMVEVLGGEIGVESQLGVGSRFWFRINKNMDHND